MRNRAVDLKWMFNFSAIESDCFIVDGNGVAERRMIDFEEVRNFCDYIKREYSL